MRYDSPVAAYLAQARQIDGLIQAKLEQIVQLRASIMRGTAMLSDMPRGGTKLNCRYLTGWSCGRMHPGIPEIIKHRAIDARDACE